MTTNELATRSDAEIAELAAGGLAELDSANLVLPVLKLTQGQTAEVQAGDVPSGIYLNSLTGESFGDAIEFIVVAYSKGRFYSDRDAGESYSAHNTDIVPDSWPEEFAGRQFEDVPEAEEQHKITANAPGGQWGRGPKIQTTHNYLGLIAGNLEVPVRFSLKSAATPVHDKLATLLKFAQAGGAQWDRVFEFGVTLKHSKRDNDAAYYVPTLRKGRATEEEERQAAVNLALQLRGANQVEFVGDEAEDARATSKPKGTGGLDPS